MRVRHLMTKDPTCCVPSDSAQRAAVIMREADAGVVPVVENEQSQKLVGIVTDRDLCMNVVAEGRDPKTTRVEQCMTSRVVSCGPNDAVQKATELMKENQIRRVPVVDDQGRVQGIVALGDVAERGDVKPTETDQTLKKVSAPTREPSKPRAQSRGTAA
jgi:CBS domain-containing protein